MRLIDEDLSYAGHWKRGKLYISRRAPFCGGFCFGAGATFDDIDEAARWMLAEVGHEGRSPTGDPVERVSLSLRDENWTLYALDVLEIADGADEAPVGQANAV